MNNGKPVKLPMFICVRTSHRAVRIITRNVCYSWVSHVVRHGDVYVECDNRLYATEMPFSSSTNARSHGEGAFKTKYARRRQCRADNNTNVNTWIRVILMADRLEKHNCIRSSDRRDCFTQTVCFKLI